MPRIGFIFDLDGTLVDSEYEISTALNLVRLSRGYSELGFSVCRSLIGLPASELFKDLPLTQTEQEDMITEFRIQLRKGITVNNNLFPGVFELLKVSRRKSIAFGIATNKPLDLATEVVKNSELSEFLFCISGTGTLKAKPSPETLLNSAREMRTEINFMFGDRTEDMQAAVSASFIPIGIAQSAHNMNDLRAAGARFVFSDFNQVLKSLDQLVSEQA